MPWARPYAERLGGANMSSRVRGRGRSVHDRTPPGITARSPLGARVGSRDAYRGSVDQWARIAGRSVNMIGSPLPMGASGCHTSAARGEDGVRYGEAVTRVTGV